MLIMGICYEFIANPCEKRMADFALQHLQGANPATYVALQQNGDASPPRRGRSGPRWRRDMATAALDFTPAHQTQAAQGRGILRRVLDAFVESRLRAAEREIARHEALFGRKVMADAGLDAVRLSNADVLPFNS
jgi:hypothetical protein